MNLQRGEREQNRGMGRGREERVLRGHWKRNVLRKGWDLSRVCWTDLVPIEIRMFSGKGRKVRNEGKKGNSLREKKPLRDLLKEH